MKTIINILGFFVIVGGTLWFGYECGKLASPPPKPKEIPSVIDIQRMVGTKPDGIVGPNTIAKWESAYANQEAAKFMTPSGGKE